MVSKLLLAVAENTLAAEEGSPQQAQLRAIYYQIREGLGFNKTPVKQGAFPLDPYSHTPWNHNTGNALPSGAKQPGMTGQVKEEILTRLLELGIIIQDGQLKIRPVLLRQCEFFNQAGTICHYFDAMGQEQSITLASHTLMFTLAQVPFIYHLEQEGTSATEIQLSALYQDGSSSNSTGNTLPDRVFHSLVQRDASLKQVMLYIPSALCHS